MSTDGDRILRNLAIVAAERERRRNDPGLDLRVQAIKRYQHARFEQTYADLLASPRYARAARFFLEELYGPGDFTSRDHQFARIVPGMVRIFPASIVGTVSQLSELHALSEELDTVMALTLSRPDVDPETYRQAWQVTGRPHDRERQIELTIAVGSALDRYVRNPFLGKTLRLMRGPAAAAGLSALQSFLENGFATFSEMRGAEEFLGVIGERERGIAKWLFFRKQGV